QIVVLRPALHRHRDRAGPAAGQHGGVQRGIVEPLPGRAARRHPGERAHVHAHAGRRCQHDIRGQVNPRSAQLRQWRGGTGHHSPHRDVYSSHSQTTLNSSIATSPPPFAASVGPVHFFGCARINSTLSTLVRASSSTVTVIRRGAYSPSRTWANQSKMLVEPISPRLNVISSTLLVLGIFRTALRGSEPSR